MVFGRNYSALFFFRTRKIIITIAQRPIRTPTSVRHVKFYATILRSNCCAPPPPPPRGIRVRGFYAHLFLFSAIRRHTPPACRYACCFEFIFKRFSGRTCFQRISYRNGIRDGVNPAERASPVLRSYDKKKKPANLFVRQCHCNVSGTDASSQIDVVRTLKAFGKKNSKILLLSNSACSYWIPQKRGRRAGNGADFDMGLLPR